MGRKQDWPQPPQQQAPATAAPAGVKSRPQPHRMQRQRSQPGWTGESKNLMALSTS